ncbi:MAG: hypothetical protein GY749_00475 [Desulfobacteraceae bacterium]|nr:hypothetical protein [Desulfobacteraceae bacterium]
MSNIISNRLNEIGMTNNQLSCLSGVRNAHLNQIQNEITQKPGRDVLIRIGLGLSWGIDGINRLLNKYDQPPLSETDISFFMRAIEMRETRSGYNAIHPGGFNFEIVIMSVEKILGNIKVVTPIPHVIFQDFEDYFSSDQVPAKEKNNSVYKEIRRFLFKHRMKVFEENISEHKISHLICKDCFESYIVEKKNKMPTDNIVEEFNRTFKGMAHENYELKLVEKCPSFKFHIREPDDQFEKPIVIFAGTPRHSPSSFAEKSEEIGALIGFISDSKELHKYFTIEFDRLDQFSIKECSDKNSMINYIISLLEKNGIKGKWEI